jgi:hypothetical protein
MLDRIRGSPVALDNRRSGRRCFLFELDDTPSVSFQGRVEEPKTLKHFHGIKRHLHHVIGTRIFEFRPVALRLKTAKRLTRAGKLLANSSQNCAPLKSYIDHRGNDRHGVGQVANVIWRGHDFDPPSELSRYLRDVDAAAREVADKEDSGLVVHYVLEAESICLARRDPGIFGAL